VQHEPNAGDGDGGKPGDPGEDDVMTNLSSRGALYLAAATMYLCATARAEEASTQAPESSDALGEIVVTARQRNERLLDVPVAVTAISGADLDRYSARNLADIAQLAPQVMVA